jgi:hypothetical protein
MMVEKYTKPSLKLGIQPVSYLTKYLAVAELE